MINPFPSIRAAFTRANTVHPSFMRLVRFVISGCTATSVNLGVIFLLTHVVGLWYLTSSVIAFMVAFLVSFSLQKFWTFEDASRKRLNSQASLFLIVILLGLAINTIFLYTLVQHAHLHYLVAQLISSIFIAVMNYFSYKYFVFKGADAE